MLKAIIFDFDGVIVDTELDRFRYLQQQLKKHRRFIKATDLTKMIGKRTHAVLSELFPDMPKEQIEKIATERKSYMEKRIIAIEPIQYIKPFVKYLNKRYILSVTSGSDNEKIKKFLTYHGLIKYFNLIVGGDDYADSNPHPKDYRITLKKLKLKPSEVIIIEDSEAGIKAAKKAKCIVFGLENKYDATHVKNADRIFKDYKSMLKYFKSLS